MIVRKTLLVIVSLILTATAFYAFVPLTGAEESMDVPLAIVEIDSDINVYGGEIKGIDSADYLMKANIRVYSGGVLYINSTSIVWNCTTDGQYGLYVNSGGQLFIEDCDMTANDTTTYVTKSGLGMYDEHWGFKWKFDFKGTGYVGNSSFGYLWGGDGNSLAQLVGGIQIYQTDIHLYNLYIMNASNVGFSIMDTAGSTTGGVDPLIEKVTVTQTSGMGFFIGGANSNPTILDSTFAYSTARGGYFFYGANATMSRCNFIHNGYDGVIYDPITYGTSFYMDNCTFNDNDGAGYGSGRGSGTTFFTDCEFNRNNASGLMGNLDPASYGIQDVVVRNSEFRDNNHSGISILIPNADIKVYDSDISYNKGHGVFNTGGSNAAFTGANNDIHHNGWWGVNTNGSGTSDSLNSNDIYGNRLGNVLVSNGSTPSISDNRINSSSMGVYVEDSMATITGNNFMDHDVGVTLLDGVSALIGGNDYSSNVIGLDIYADGVEISGESFTSNTDIGLNLNNVNNVDVENCIFDMNNEGIRVIGGDFVELWDVQISRSSTAGITGFDGSNFTIQSGGLTTMIDTISLDEGSKAYSFSVNIPSSTVTIVDSDSEFWQYWWMSLIVADNVTFMPVDTADVVIFGATMDEISTGMTVADGSWTELVLSYTKIGQNTFDYNPVNITVSKNGYVPFWGGGETFNADLNKTILLSENRLPEFPIDPAHTPDETHQKRPMIVWSEAWDWNSDVIKYNVNVYMDELYGEDHIVQDVVVREPMYTFNKNLRYNRVYWVEIKSFDPWGLSDTYIFSFETVNSPPSTPEVGFLFTPVSTQDDITVVILNQSTDIDTDPVDQLSYLIEWYAYREESWVLVASGINMTVLPSEKTREGEDMKVIVKPYDGIEYGLSAEIFIKVVNFVPDAVMEYVDLEIDEDQEGIDLIDLKTLFMDRDGDDLSFRVKSERHVVAVIDQVTNNVTFIPDPNWIGEDQVIIEAFDTKQHDEDWPTVTINITVNAVNDAPTISFVNEEPISQGEIFLIQGIQGSIEVITIGASDPDELYGDEYTFSTNFLEVVGEGIIPDGDFVFETNTGRMSIFLSNALVGEYVFNITATDQSNDESTIQVRLLVENTNDPPENAEITLPTSGLSVEQKLDERVEFTAATSDDPDLHIPDSNELLSYDWDFGDGSDILTNAGTSVSHQFLVTGNYTVKLMVKDNFGEVVEHEITIFVEVEGIVIDPIDPKGPEGRTTLFLIIVLIVIGIILLAVILFFAMRKDPLQETAEAEEQAHEALVAKQQEDALIAQDRLQALLSGATVQGVSGPALPAAGGEGSEMEALPAAPTEEVPGMEPPMEPVAYPEQPMGYDQPPVQEPPMEQPVHDQAPPVPEPVPAPEPAPMEAAAPPPVPEPVPAPGPAPMQAAPAGTVPMPVAPEAQSNLPSPEEPQQ